MTTLLISARRLLLSLFALSLMLLAALPVHGQEDVQPQENVQSGEEIQSVEAVATDCTWFASPTGNANNAGTSLSSPLTLTAAYQKAIAGQVVCLLSGTYGLSSPFYITKGGTASAYITYKSYDTASPALIKWTSSTRANIFQTDNNASYLKFVGLKLDGNNVANAGIKCSSGSHHIEVLKNTLDNVGASGISAVGCDYLTIDGNKVYHTGYGHGWGSGISLNSSVWFDRADGFHSYVVNNIVAGGYDGSTNHSDGNGIIMDRGDDTPPVLIANNLVYQNGGRCIHIKMNRNKWVINNTCYANSLDGQIAKGSGSVGEYSVSDSTNVYFINNAVKAWTKGYPFLQGNSTVQYNYNTYFGDKGLMNVVATAANDSKQLRKVDPLFVNPATLDPSADGQYRNALHPSQVGTRYQLAPSSTLINAGVDPRNVPGVTPALRAGIDKYLLKDLNGVARPQGTGFDIGAYESNSP